MSQNNFSTVHPLYLKDETNVLKKSFPLSYTEGYAIKTIGIGDGHTLFLDTYERFCNQDECEGVALPSVHPFSRKADPQLHDKFLMDHTALDMLLKEPTQKFLKKIHRVYKCHRVEARFAFTESENHVEVIGAERSKATGVWFQTLYSYHRGVSRKYKPLILAFLPPKHEAT